MKTILNKIGDKLIYVYLYLLGAWLIFAFCFQIYGTYIELTNPTKAQNISNQIDWKLDGTFKDNPNNIWH